MDFGKRLKNIMLLRGMSQVELSEIAKCSAASISRYINKGDLLPPGETLINLSRGLNVSVDYLLGITNIPNTRTKDDEFCFVLYQCYSKASDRDRQIIESVLNEYMEDDDDPLSQSPDNPFSP